MDCLAFDTLAWLHAWTLGVQAHWPGDLPPPVGDLMKLRDSLPFSAPELLRDRIAEAWSIYQDNGDTDVGRAAVALTYITIASKKKP